MDDMEYVKKKCFTTEAGGCLNLRLLSVVLTIAIAGAMLCNQVSAQISGQNPCNEMGADCRVLTAEEVKAFKELVLAVKVLLPVPDLTRYEPDGAIEASSMPFIAETKIPGVIPTGLSWQTGCFPDYPYNTLLFGYDSRAVQGKPAGKEKDPLAAVQAIATVIESKIEISVELRPYAYLVDSEDGKAMDVPDQDAYNIEKNDQFLSWQSGDDRVDLNMIFGPRTVNEAETLRMDKPATRFAPLKSIALVIIGPKNEVAALKKIIDRQKFAALLGPVVK